MSISDKKSQFIEAWGQLGPKWGINRTMAQIHALLLMANEPKCSCCIREDLDISVGCVNQNLRTLVNWGLIHGVDVEGERKEYFVAEKDMWDVFTKIIKIRKEEELVPLQNLLNDLYCMNEHQSKDPDCAEFQDTIKEIKCFADKADKMLDTLVTGENSWMIKGFKMMIR